MTLFDVIAVLILLVSAVIGFVRGALREISTVFAFVLAILVAIFALRFTSPLARHAIHPDWAANAVAVLIIFVAAYLLFRALGSGLTGKVHEVEALGSLDRLVGVAFGLIRALVLLGLFNLVFGAASPGGRQPHWISNAALYPLSSVSAKVLRGLAPKGTAVAGRIGPSLEDAIRTGVTSKPSSDAPHSETRP